MVRTLPRHAGLLALLGLALGACTQNSGGGGGSSTADSVCDSDPRAMSYAAGLSAKSSDGTLKATFMDASPAPPEKGINTWTLQLTDATGNPVSGATITVKPWMPDHGHGASITPQVMAMSTAGTYEVSLLDFFMPGIWQITLDVTPTSGPAESVMFSFCIDG